MRRTQGGAIRNSKRFIKGPSQNRYFIEFICKEAILHPNSKVDLAIFVISPKIKFLKQSYNIELLFASVPEHLIPTEKEWNNLDAIETLTMIGYPNGIWDRANNLPVFRQGITATHPSYNFQGEPQFLADMSCFPGSSGSPVFLLNQGAFHTKMNNGLCLGTRAYLLGIQSRSMIRQEIGKLVDISNTASTQQPVVQSFINLGIIIKSSELLKFKTYFGI
ncbi:MAG: hypothetical protein ACLVD7_12655 [[Clostridium] leptum]